MRSLRALARHRHSLAHADRIVLRDLVFRGRHGVLAAERELGQRFEVDIVMQTDHEAAAASDHIDDTVSYVGVYDQVRSVVEGSPRALIETVAVEVAREVLSGNARVDEVTVVLRKPQVPINGILAYASVEVSRDREWLESLRRA